MVVHQLQGRFKASEALVLVTQMIHLKIKHHESKLKQDSSVDEVKYQEAQIKSLQKELFELTSRLDGQGNNLKIDAIITIEK